MRFRLGLEFGRVKPFSSWKGRFMHPWLAPIAASAVLLGLYDICRKHAVHANAVAEVLLISSSS